MADPRELPAFDPLGIAYRTGILGAYPDRLNVAGEALLNPGRTVQQLFQGLSPAGDVQDAVAGSATAMDAAMAGDPWGVAAGIGGMGLALAGTMLPGRPAAALDPIEEAYRQQRRQQLGYDTRMYHGMKGTVAEQISHMEPEPTRRSLPNDPKFKGQMGDFGIHLTPDPATANRAVVGGYAAHLQKMIEGDKIKVAEALAVGDQRMADLLQDRMDQNSRQLDRLMEDTSVLPFWAQTPRAARMNDLGRWDTPINYLSEYYDRGTDYGLLLAELEDKNYGPQRKFAPKYLPKFSDEDLIKMGHDPAFMDDLRQVALDAVIQRERKSYGPDAVVQMLGRPDKYDFSKYRKDGVFDDAAYEQDLRDWMISAAPKVSTLLDEVYNYNPDKYWREGFARTAEKYGYNSIVYSNSIEGKGEDSFMYFDPSDVRSTQAQFDLARRHDPNMMASIAAIMGLGVGSGVALEQYLSDDPADGGL